MEARYCTQCGAANPAGVRFCGNCGNALATGVRFSAPDQVTRAVAPTYAGFWIRFLAAFIDGIAINIATQPLVLALGTGFDFETGTDLAGNPTFDWGFDGSRFAITILLTTLLTGLYYIIAISRWGQTLGALAVSIKVVRPDGSLLSTGQAAIRWIGSWVSGGLTLGIGYLMMIWSARKQTLHDKMAGSVVIKVKRPGEV